MRCIQSLGVAVGFAILSLPSTTVVAQTGGQQANGLEEILVTGRKRAENLIDVPVSISVWSAQALADQGIINQDDLFAGTPGLDYSNYRGTRNANNPGIRGVQSNLRANNQQKVASFVDGMPMQGGTGNLQFAGVEAVEVYRGPQSAAFGRSTFAGAINYVTSDSTEEFEGKVQLQVTDLNQTEAGVVLSGPLSDNLGYRVSYVKGDNQGPSEWTASDGQKISQQKTDALSTKINFQFSEAMYGELTYSRLKTADSTGPGVMTDPSTCGADSGIYSFSMGVDAQLPNGAWDCDHSIPNGGFPRNSDPLTTFLAQYDANIGYYTAAARMADSNMNGSVSSSEYLAQTLSDGTTYEQSLLNNSPQNFGNMFELNRKRITGELNFEIGDGLLQVLGMKTDEGYDFFQEWDNHASNPVFVVNMMTMRAALNMNVQVMHVTNTTEETYLETRWISSAEEKLRYTLSAAYYEYDLQQQVYQAGGALPQYHNLKLPNGAQVNPFPGITITEVASNIGASFGVQYDIADATTLSFEGRYQTDDVCGQDKKGANIKLCSTTTAFLPRVAITHSVNDGRTVYGQVSVGNNPAGVNTAMSDPGNIQALLVASGQLASPDDGFTYNGADGVHFPSVDYDASNFKTFKEEKLTNFEIGTKGSFADGRGQLNAALYFMKYENMIGAENLSWEDDDINGWNESQWTTFTGERSWLNQGDDEMYGIEIDGTYSISDIWQVGGYVTLSSSKYTDYCTIQGPNYRDAPGGAGGGGKHMNTILTPDKDGVESSCAVANGKWIPRQSPVSAMLNITADLPDDIFGLQTSLRADIRYKGSFYEDQLNYLERVPVATVNVSANMRNENWNVRLFINNLTNNDEPLRTQAGNLYIDQANPTIAPPNNGTWLAFKRRPREIGLQLGYTF